MFDYQINHSTESPLIFKVGDKHDEVQVYMWFLRY